MGLTGYACTLVRHFILMERVVHKLVDVMRIQLLLSKNFDSMHQLMTMTNMDPVPSPNKGREGIRYPFPLQPNAIASFHLILNGIEKLKKGK
uniref:Uncharacterized protein n=1 Tax=Setaria viridis TaxID=4556 RepID=A0A4U6VFD4_SETVI|nr:hypothetical protein SEVIR_3G236200v2 [Setaria viridis]